MVERLESQPCDYYANSDAAGIARVLLDELANMPQEHLNLPISNHPKAGPIVMA